MAMKAILKKVHIYFYQFNVGIVYIIFWPLMYYFSRKQERYKQMNIMRGAWGYLSSLFSGITYRFEYEQPIDWSRTYIICPNHISNLDITAVSIMAKNNYCFIGKDELLEGFVTGLFFRTVDLPVNRESKISSFKVFKKAADRLKDGMTVIIFPEGRIPNHYPPKLAEFKNGPFRLAIELKIPIIPVTSLDTWKTLWDNGMRHGSKPGVCNIFVHAPIETAHLTIDDADELKNKVHDIINQKFEHNEHR